MNEIKQRIVDQISNHIDKQNQKGLKTYGHTLEDCPAEKYDWKDMLIEELIDGVQYAHKRAIEAEKERDDILDRYQKELAKARSFGR